MESIYLINRLDLKMVKLLMRNIDFFFEMSELLTFVLGR